MQPTEPFKLAEPARNHPLWSDFYNKNVEYFEKKNVKKIMYFNYIL